MDVPEVRKAIDQLKFLTELAGQVSDLRLEIEILMEKHARLIAERDQEIERLHQVIQTYSDFYER